MVMAAVLPTGSSLAPDADHVHELREVLQDSRNAARELDRGDAFLVEVERDLDEAEPRAFGSKHELGGEHVLVDDALLDHGEDGLAPEGLEPVGVRSPEAQRDPEHASDDPGRGAA